MQAVPPPNWLGSIVQGTTAHSRALEAERRAAAAHAGGAEAAAAAGKDEFIADIEKAAEVENDGHGQSGGSQGRDASGGDHPAAREPDEPAASSGLDITA